MRYKTLLLLFILILGFSACKKSRLKDPEYSNFKVLKLTLTQMPFQDKSNSDWDILDGPDVFFKMESASRSVLFNGSGIRYADVIPSELPLSWDFVPAYQITNIEATQYVSLYDYDTFDPNDEIGYVAFTLSEHKNGYPKVITKTQDGITVTITGDWY